MIGVADVTESRWVMNLRLRILQNKKRRTQVTTRAKRPKTEITAIAQWGKDEVWLLFCTVPVGLDVEDKLESDRAVGKDDEAENIVESIESGYVVSASSGPISIGEQVGKIGAGARETHHGKELTDCSKGCLRKVVTIP
jgi:hypothetical protein